MKRTHYRTTRRTASAPRRRPLRRTPPPPFLTDAVVRGIYGETFYQAALQINALHYALPVVPDAGERQDALAEATGDPAVAYACAETLLHAHLAREAEGYYRATPAAAVAA